MTNKSKSTANETKSIDASMDAVLSKISSQLSKIKGISPFLVMNEMADFIKRNSLAITRNKTGKATLHCCCKCLKAHMEKIASQLSIDKNVIKPLCSVLNCQAGHNGYYVDSDRIVKL